MPRIVPDMHITSVHLKHTRRPGAFHRYPKEQHSGINLKRGRKGCFFCMIFLTALVVVSYSIYGYAPLRRYPKDQRHSNETVYLEGQVYRFINGLFPTPAAEEMVEARLERLQQFCKKHESCKGVKHCPYGDPSTAILVHDSHNVMWCDIAKVASTALKWKLCSLSGKPVNVVPSLHTANTLKKFGIRYLSSYTPEEKKYRLEKYFKFVFVRHPVLRLLSAYREKFLNGTFFPRLAQEFLRQIRNSSYKSVYVQFHEYISLLTNTGLQSDIHFATYREICRPCSINYDFIGKLETFDRDLKTILKLKYNVSEENEINFDKDTRKHATNGSFQLAKEYISKLPQSQRENIYRRLDPDMKMFGYDWEGVL